jgi:bla regulator protein blaR1
MNAPDFASGLMNHLWQSTVVVFIAWLLTLALRNHRAAMRYWVWLAASMKFFLPFSLLIAAGELMRPAVPGSLEQKSFPILMEQITEPYAQIQPAISLRPSNIVHNAHVLPLVLFSLWACGALIVALTWWRKWRAIRAQVESASPLELVAGVPAMSSQSLSEPGVFGIARPVMLLPEGIVDRLTAAQLDAIVAHEICHVRRRDNLTFALHMLVEIVFWFHPLVWWIRARLIEERERACDEAVLQSGNESEAYAESILRVCRFYVESPLACVSGVSGSDLKKRIVRIMSARLGTRLGFAGKALLAAAAITVAAGPLAFGMLRAAQVPGQLLHPGDTPLPSFEVATIKPSNEDRPGLWIRMSPEDFASKHTSVKDLIKYAYHTKSDDQVLGSPGWMNSEFFDVEAKAGEGEIASLQKLPFDQRMDQSRLMVQSLLVDRFQLSAHFETRDLPVYGLTVAKGGPKLKEVEASPFPPPGTQPPPGAHLTSIGMRTPGHITGSAVPMRMMTDWLSNFDELGNRVVVDDTGLKGTYDFTLDGVSMKPSSDPQVTSIFTALQDQLGLKLVPRRAQLEVLVIDRIEKPSEN